MSDKTNLVNTPEAKGASATEAVTNIQGTAAERADAVAQKKLAGLAYAENYRQKLREEKAQRVSPVRRKAEAERLEQKERERRERLEKMEQMLKSEKASVAERNAQSDAVLSVIAEAEREKSQREAEQPSKTPETTVEETAVAEVSEAEKTTVVETPEAEETAVAETSEAEETAVAETSETEETVVAETSETEETTVAETSEAEETAAIEAREAEEKAAEEQAAAEEAARREAAVQVQQIVARVEAERAAEEKMAAERAAAEARAAEEKAAAERAAEEKAAAERAAVEAQQAARQSKQEAIRREAAEMAAMCMQSAKEESERRRGGDAAVVAKPVSARSSGTSGAADDLRSERRRARQHALERVRSDRMADRVGHLSYEENGYEPTAQSGTYEAGFDTDIEDAALVGVGMSSRDRARRLAYEKREGRLVKRDQRMVEKRRRMPEGTTEPLSTVPLYTAPESAPYDSLAADMSAADEAELRSVQAAVREARQAERDAKRAMKEAERTSVAERDYDAERDSVAPAVVRDVPAQAEPLTLDTLDAEAIVQEEKYLKREDRRANKLVRRVMSGKKERRKDQKTVERLLDKETRRKEQTEGVVAKEVAKAERVLRKAEKKDQRAQRRVDRAQRVVDKLAKKQAQMEAKHARRLAKRPGLARQLNAREELLARDLLKAYKQVDKAAHKEEKKAQRVLAAQQRLDRVLGKQAKVERKNDRRMERIRRAEAQVDRRMETFDRKATRRMSKNELAVERAAARQNLVIYKGEIPRSLHSVSSRQLAYEKRRMKKGELTRVEAERTVEALTTKTRSVAKAENRLAKAEKGYAALGRLSDKQQKKVDRLSARLERMEEEHAQLLDKDASLAPKLLAKERKLTRKLSRAKKKVTAADRRQDAFEKKHILPALSVLESAQKKQTAEQNAQAKRLLRAKRRSDRDAYRTDRKKVERKNIEEKRRVLLEKRAVDAAELASLTEPRLHDTRKIRVLKRQVKQASKRERDAELRVSRSRRIAEKAALKNELKNHENERIVERNPRAYGHILKETEKNRRRLAAIERAAERDERRLARANRRTEKAVLKLEKALGKRTDDNGAVAAYYGKTVAQPYIKEDASLSRSTRREQKREAARARAEEREYERLMAKLRREGEAAPMIEPTSAEVLYGSSEPAVSDTPIEMTVDYPVSPKASRRARRERQSNLHTLDRLYEERTHLEERVARAPENIGAMVRLVNLQKEICDEHFFMLRKTDIRTDTGALALAEQATEEIRRYNRYISELNRKSGRYYSFAKLTGAYRILEGKNPTPISLVTYKASKAQRNAPTPEPSLYGEETAEPVGIIDEGYTYDTAKPSVGAMSKREFAAYVNGILKTNVGIEKQKRAVRKQQRKQKHHAFIRSQTELLTLQKSIIDNYLRIFTVAREEGRAREVRSLVGGATAKIREYNRELKRLEQMDHSQHIRLDTDMPKRLLAGGSYREIPTLVCSMPGVGNLDGSEGMGGGLSATDRALIESRFNYRISGVTRSLKDDRYDYVLFPSGARHSRRSKRQLLNELKAERKLAIAAEERDNRRYEALMSYEPREAGRAARGVNNREVLALRRDVNRLLLQRDDINRELLSLYAMAEGGVSVNVSEQYEDGTVVRGGKRCKKDAPYIVHSRGYVTRRGRQVYSPDEEFARVYDKEKHRQYNKGMKRIAEVRKLALPSTNKDVQALFALNNRRVDLVTLIETTDKKIRIYGFKGKAAAAVRKERRNALKELKRVDREIKQRMMRARDTSRRRPKPFWQ